MTKVTVSLSLLLSCFAFAEEPEPIRIRVGEERTIDVSDYTRLAIGQPDVVGVKASKEGGQLTVIGRSVGKTTLLVWQKRGKRVPYLIDVRGEPKAKTAEVQPVKPTELVMSRGTQRVVNVPGVSRIAIGDPEIADVRALDNGDILVTAGTEGRTTMMVWNKGGERLEYEVNVGGGSREEPTVSLSSPVVQLRVGERRHMNFAGASKVGVPDKSIVRLELGENMNADLIGKAEGETLLPVWDRENTRVDYRVVVTR